MNDDESRFGRAAYRPKTEPDLSASKPPEPLLSEEDRARIRAEEEYRAQVRAEAEHVPTPQEKAEQLKVQQAQAAAARGEAAQRKAQLEKERRAKLTPAQRAGETIFVVALVIALFAFGGWLFKGCFTTSSSPAQVSGGLMREYCLSAVRDKLKAPSSAEFNDPTLPVQNSAGMWTWTSQVEADNSFGAKIRTEFYCAGKGSDADNITAEAVLF